jgi:hypothetical protein
MANLMFQIITKLVFAETTGIFSVHLSLGFQADMPSAYLHTVNPFPRLGQTDSQHVSGENNRTDSFTAISEVNDAPRKVVLA